MRKFLHIILLGMLIGAGSAAANPAVRSAAAGFMGGVAWQENSVLSADFSCTGKTQSAILGTSDKEIVVAVFTKGLASAPEVLRFASADRNPAQAKIRLDDASLTPDEVATLSGAVPPGYRPSKTCKGVRLSDDTSEAAHIYWDHDAKRFDSWTQ